MNDKEILKEEIKKQIEKLKQEIDAKQTILESLLLQLEIEDKNNI